MSKIYEALRRHERNPGVSGVSGQQPAASRGPLVRALESIYPIIYKLAREAEHGLVLHFVASSVGEGTSTLSSEFALVAARADDSRVLLVDGDRTQLTTATNFGCPTDLGIVDRVQSGASLEETTMTPADNTRLEVGVLCGQRSPALSRKALPVLYEQFRAKYDLTIIDCPAVFSDRYFGLCPEAADGVVLIVQAEHSRPEIIRQAKSLIENAGGKIIGSILNRRHTYIPDFLYRLL
jgi:Mrp family chromosome partitioning ATPase